MPQYKKIIQHYNPTYRFHEDETNRDLVRNSEQRCFFVVDFDHCRGIDHRIQDVKQREQGLDLLIATKLPEPRTLA